MATDNYQTTREDFRHIWKCRVRFDKRLGRPLRDLEARDGIWIISPTMKAVLEEIDSGACEFRKCETVLSSGEPGRETSLRSVTRIFARRECN
jgi:Protein of unknown function (DUF1629)